MRNGFVESLNGRILDELLNKTMFHDLAHALVVITDWAADYNTERAHSVLDCRTPADYALALTTAQDESSTRRTIAQVAPTGVNTTGLRTRLDESSVAGHRWRLNGSSLNDHLSTALVRGYGLKMKSIAPNCPRK